MHFWNKHNTKKMTLKNVSYFFTEKGFYKFKQISYWLALSYLLDWKFSIRSLKVSNHVQHSFILKTEINS